VSDRAAVRTFGFAIVGSGDCDCFGNIPIRAVKDNRRDRIYFTSGIKVNGNRSDRLRR
jgi:hypothetical protein